jgi:hypothetical protein
MDKYVQFGGNKVYKNMKKIKHYKIEGLELLRNRDLPSTHKALGLINSTTTGGKKKEIKICKQSLFSVTKFENKILQECFMDKNSCRTCANIIKI